VVADARKKLNVKIVENVYTIDGKEESDTFARAIACCDGQTFIERLRVGLNFDLTNVT
jgi:hypothetical protein